MVFILQEEPQQEGDKEKGRPRRPSRGEQEEEHGPPAKKKKGGEEEEGSSISLGDMLKRRGRSMSAREKMSLLGASVSVGWKSGEGKKGEVSDSGKAEDFWFLPYLKSREFSSCSASSCGG